MYSNMSAEKQMPLEEQIHGYLKPHAFGKTRDDIHKEFRGDFEPEEIDQCLERMIGNKWILDTGKLKWQPKPGS